MREFLDISNELYEDNKQSYLNMFSSLINAMEEVANEPTDDPNAEERKQQFARNANLLSDMANNSVSWARKHLRKNDRIVWFLRIKKAEMVRKLLMNKYPSYMNEWDSFKKFSNVVQKIIKTDEFKKNQNTRTVPSIDNNLEVSLSHFLSLPVPQIQQHVWKDESVDELINIFTSYEGEWQDSISDENSIVEIETGDELLLKFNGEPIKGWWLLDRGSCSAEANAMGHCGNQPSEQTGDRILSFRTKVYDDNWSPHLTFILHKNGYLGEMKGKANEKPRDRYHKYILPLLKLDIIKGIVGGGYEPENNFSLDDLSKEDKKKLIEDKPSLGSIKEHYNFLMSKFSTGKALDDIKERIDQTVENMDLNVGEWKEDVYEIEEWKDAEDLIGDIGDDFSKETIKNVDDYFDYYGGGYSHRDREEFLNQLSDDQMKTALKEIGGDKLVEIWKNDDLDVYKSLIDLINEEYTDIDMMIDRAMDEGNRIGAESEMYNAIISAIERFTLEHGGTMEMSAGLHDKITFSMKIGEVADQLSDKYVLENMEYDNNWYCDNKIKVEEPRYGWSDYNQEAAIEYFIDVAIYD